MKRVISLLLVGIFLMITGCQKPEKNNSSNEFSGDPTGPITLTHYSKTFPEFINWLNTVDAEKYPENDSLQGQLEPFVGKIRKDGSILVPYYEGKLVEFGGNKANYIASISAKAKYEEEGYGYRFIVNNYEITVSIKCLDEEYLGAAKKGYDQYQNAKWNTPVPTTEKLKENNSNGVSTYLKKMSIGGKEFNSRTTQYTDKMVFDYIFEKYRIRISSRDILEMDQLEQTLEKISFQQYSLNTCLLYTSRCV